MLGHAGHHMGVAGGQGAVPAATPIESAATAGGALAPSSQPACRLRSSTAGLAVEGDVSGGSASVESTVRPAATTGIDDVSSSAGSAVTTCAGAGHHRRHQGKVRGYRHEPLLGCVQAGFVGEQTRQRGHIRVLRGLGFCGEKCWCITVPVSGIGVGCGRHGNRCRGL